MSLHTSTVYFKFANMFRGISLVLAAWVFSDCAAAAPQCNASAEGSQAYIRATRTVQRLPEVKAWSREHGFPVAYGEAADKQVLLAGRCYWSVTVYADRPERLELWHVFYVGTPAMRVLIEDPVRGEPISLRAWRKEVSKLVNDAP